MRPGLLAMAALALAASTPLGAQDVQRALTTRIAVVSDATVCDCTIDGVRAPRARDLFIVALGFQRRLAGDADGRWVVAYAPEFLPLVLSRRTADARLNVWRCDDGSRTYCGEASTSDPWTVNAYGVGVLPLSFTARARLARAVGLRVRVAGGGVRLSQPVPLMQGRKFNFVAEGAAAADIHVSGRVSISVGTVLNHISNGQTSPVNLGMDSRMLEIGASVRR